MSDRQSSSETTAPHQPGRVRCPRCGYDLRGVVAGWDDRCDLHGRCAECGAGVDWAVLLSDKWFGPAWLVESNRLVQPFFKAAVVTFLRSWRPRRFWSSIPATDHIAWRRIAMYILLVLFIPKTAFYVVQQCSVLPSTSGLVSSYSGEHIERGNLLLRAVFTPLSEQPHYDQFGYRYPSLAPGRHWPWRQGNQLPGEMRWLADRLFLLAIAATLVPALLTGFLLRRAHDGHVVRNMFRATLYGCAVLILLAWLGAFLVLAGHHWKVLYAYREKQIIELILLLGLPWLVVWWGAVLKHYFRIDSPYRTATVAVVMVVLLMIVVAVWTGTPIEDIRPSIFWTGL